MCKHRKVFSLLVLMDESLTIGISHFPLVDSQSTLVSEVSIKPIQHMARVGLRTSRVPSGDYITKVTPVPISNTVVKLCEPMIVPTSAKVGIAGFLKSLVARKSCKAFFV